MLDGPDIVVTAQHQVSIKAGGTVIIQGEPTVQINPPLVTREADAAKPPPPPDEHPVVPAWSPRASRSPARACTWARGRRRPPGPLTTDGRGQVRVPVAQAGTHRVVLGAPPRRPPGRSRPRGAGHPGARPCPRAEQAAGHVGTTPAQPTPKAKPTLHEVPIAVEIVEPAAGATFEIDPGSYPGPAPSMPAVTLKAKVLVHGQETSAGTVRWEFSISGKYRVRDHSVKPSNYRWQEFKFAAGTATTKPNEEKKVELAPAELTGGDLQIKAVYQAGPELGNVTATQVLTGLKLVGKNGPRIDVERYIVDQAGDLRLALPAHVLPRVGPHARRVQGHPAALRAALRRRHRAAGPGGGGVGVAEGPARRRPSNFFPRIFWDWRKNVVSGMQHFLATKVPTARRIVANLRKAHPGLAQPPEGLILRAAIRAYNGGRELAVSDDGKHFVVSPHTIPANVGYVEWVLGDPHGTLAPKHPVPDDVKLKRWPAT